MRSRPVGPAHIWSKNGSHLDLSLAQIAAIRQAIDAPIDFYVESPDDFGGAVRHDETPTDGCFVAPDRPGLGLALNHTACEKHPRTGGRIKLVEEGWERRQE